jgi:hypothetical protein
MVTARIRFLLGILIATFALPVFAASTASATESNETRSEPARVEIGAYVDNLQSIELATNSFSADLYVWFRWSDPLLKPYESIEVVNTYAAWSLVVTPLQQAPVQQPDGSFYYVQRYQGSFNSNMSLSKFPFSDLTLQIRLGERYSESEFFQLVPDDIDILVDPETTLPGYRLVSSSFTVLDRQYPTNFGDPADPNPDAYSQAWVEMVVAYPWLSSVVKFLVPILLVVITASLVFQIPPAMIDARIGLGITALLTLVAMQWSATDGLPHVEYLTLLDMLYIASFILVIATIVQSIYGTWMARRGDEERAIRTDKRSMVISLTTYVIVIALVVWVFLR